MDIVNTYCIAIVNPSVQRDKSVSRREVRIIAIPIPRYDFNRQMNIQISLNKRMVYSLMMLCYDYVQCVIF